MKLQKSPWSVQKISWNWIKLQEMNLSALKEQILSCLEATEQSENAGTLCQKAFEAPSQAKLNAGKMLTEILVSQLLS